MHTFLFIGGLWVIARCVSSLHSLLRQKNFQPGTTSSFEEIPDEDVVRESFAVVVTSEVKRQPDATAPPPGLPGLCPGAACWRAAADPALLDEGLIVEASHVRVAQARAFPPVILSGPAGQGMSRSGLLRALEFCDQFGAWLDHAEEASRPSSEAQTGARAGMPQERG